MRSNKVTSPDALVSSTSLSLSLSLSLLSVSLSLFALLGAWGGSSPPVPRGCAAQSIIFSFLPSKDEPALQGNFEEQLTTLQLVEATRLARNISHSYKLLVV